MNKKSEPEIEMEPDAMERMDRALREAMKTPHKPLKDVRKPRKKRVYKGKQKDE
jgi:hypothetical protein